MNATAKHIPNAIVHLYTRKEGTLMRPTYGVIILYNQGSYAVSVAHTMEDRKEVELWNGIHPEVAKGLGVSGQGELLRKNCTDEILLDREQDLMAIPLPDYAGFAFTRIENDVGLMRTTLIACLDYDLINGVLVKTLDGQAGIVEQETSVSLRLSTQGKTGMSGAPVVVQREDDKDLLSLVGLYAGTCRSTPLTSSNTSEHARVLKIEDFLKSVC